MAKRNQHVRIRESSSPSKNWSKPDGRNRNIMGTMMAEMKKPYVRSRNANMNKL